MVPTVSVKSLGKITYWFNQFTSPPFLAPQPCECEIEYEYTFKFGSVNCMLATKNFTSALNLSAGWQFAWLRPVDLWASCTQSQSVEPQCVNTSHQKIGHLFNIPKVLYLELLIRSCDYICGWWHYIVLNHYF